MEGPVPVPRREDPFLSRASRQGLLLLLRMRRQGRRDHVRERDRAPRVSRGRRLPRAPRRHHAPDAPERHARGPRERDAGGRGARSGGRFFPREPRSARSRQGAPRKTRPLARGLSRVRSRRGPRRVGRAEDVARSACPGRHVSSMPGCFRKTPRRAACTTASATASRSRSTTGAARSWASARAPSETISRSTSIRRRRRASRRASSSTASTARKRRSAGRTPFCSSRAISTASRVSARAPRTRSPRWGRRSRPRRWNSSGDMPRTVIVAYDGDAPGGAAALQGHFRMLLEHGVNVTQLVAFPDGRRS